MKTALHLGCGQATIPCDETTFVINLDLARPREMLPGTEFVQHDLESGTVPFADDYFDCIITSHTLEHIRNLLPLMQDCYRAAKHDALFYVRVPFALSEGQFSDPTHVRFFVPSTFWSFSQSYYWRADYGYRGNWEVEDIFVTTRKDAPLIIHQYDEIHCLLRAVKPCPPPPAHAPTPFEVDYISDDQYESFINKIIRKLDACGQENVS